MLFFDTYALIEIIKGSNSYKRYVKEMPITTKLNLMELYYYLLRKEWEDKAEYYYSFYFPSCVPVSDDIIKMAMKYKLRFKDRKLSYVDCIGYIIAKKMDIKFLTGDNQFKDMENVEFVK